ncbi:MAG: twin-arginine translocase TatA/TatE family subunit [Phycisphaeraceae bacterium JB051]
MTGPNMATTLAFLNLGNWEIIIILALGLLIFGRRLPEVGRSLGKGIVEFKKGLSGVEDEINNAGKDDGGDTKSASQLDSDANQASTSNTQNESTKTH